MSRVPVTLRLGQSLRNRLAALAMSEGLSLNEWINRQLEKAAQQ
jgi:predicted HicB family RNase H-like nuclease